jgi:hypothetical protein
MNLLNGNDSETRDKAGRPLGLRGVRALAARYSRSCLKTLAEVANSKHAPEADRVRAAEVILAYATKPNGETP